MRPKCRGLGPLVPKMVRRDGGIVNLTPYLDVELIKFEKRMAVGGIFNQSQEIDSPVDFILYA